MAVGNNVLSGVRMRTPDLPPRLRRALYALRASTGQRHERCNNCRMLTKSDQLKDRITARKHELLAKVAEFKADARDDAAASRDAMKAKLADLEDSLKDGWENMTDAVKTKLNKWLD